MRHQNATRMVTRVTEGDGRINALEPISKINLTKEVVRRFKLLLEQGKLRPGGRLPPERELARLLGISRPSLRHGLKALELMGAIVSRRRLGTFVSGSAGSVMDNPLDLIILLTNISFDEVFEVRKIVEVELSALSAKRASNQEIEAIESSLAKQKANLKHPVEFLKQDLEFHGLIANSARNTLFSLFLAGIHRLVARNMQISLRLRHESDLLRTYQEHCEIQRNLKLGDEAGSRRAMISHLDRVYAQWQQRHGQEKSTKTVKPSPKRMS
jgi:GntR family transcriptional regulator, transcriptional repressor for pyruvate dehydrogenase complex